MKPVQQSDSSAHALPTHLASSSFLFRYGHTGQPLRFTMLVASVWSVEDYADAALFPVPPAALSKPPFFS